MRVVRGELVMPLEFARIRIERQNRARVEIVARARVSVIVRPRIARAPEHRIRRRGVRAAVPRRHPAGLPRIAGPGAEIRLSRLWDRIEAPDTFAGGGVVGVDEPGNGMFP